nr:hypothetical protein [Tanacetum cinerariifolium]
LDLVETGEPAETVVRLPEVVEQKIPAHLELIGEELVVATLVSSVVRALICALRAVFVIALGIGARAMRTVHEVIDQTLSSVSGFISTLDQSYQSPDGMGSIPVRSLHSTRSLSFKGIPFLAMKSICASAVLTYEQTVQGLTWRTAFVTKE